MQLLGAGPLVSAAHARGRRTDAVVVGPRGCCARPVRRRVLHENGPGGQQQQRIPAIALPKEKLAGRAILQSIRGRGRQPPSRGFCVWTEPVGQNRVGQNRVGQNRVGRRLGTAASPARSGRFHCTSRALVPAGCSAAETHGAADAWGPSPVCIISSIFFRRTG